MKSPRKRMNIKEKWTIPLALAAGGIAAVSGAAPTGHSVLDPVLTGLSVAFVTWTAAAAQWWVLLIGTGLVMATVGNLILTIASIGPFALAIWLGLRLRSQSTLRSLIVAIVLNIALRSNFDVYLGSSALVGIGVGSMFLASGTVRRSRFQRRVVIAVLATSAGLAVVSGSALAASTYAMRSDIDDAVDNVRSGIDQLSAGDPDDAAMSLEDAAQKLERVNEWIDAPWTQPARLVPIVAQHRRAVVDLTGRAAELANVVSEEIDVLQLNALRPVLGRIDLDALDRARISVDRLLASVESLSGSIDDARSVWLAEPLTRELDDLDTEIDRELVSARRARDVVHLAPALLGEEETRRYFLAFTSPAEARGGGGFMGSWAEVEIVDGQILLTRSGRTKQLNTSSDTTRTVTGPADFVARYGSYGFVTGDAGVTARDIWSVINLSPHFPSTADVITQLYPQSGGAELDGVITLDVYALARFLEFTGPIAVQGLGEPLDAANAAQFLLYDQYRLPGDSADRIDALESVTRQVVTRLLAGAFPDPRGLVDALAPMVAEGRVAAYAVRPEEQALFADLKMTGALETREIGDVLTVSLNNASASKLELFLDGTVDYSLSVDADGRARSTATISLTNSAPTSGWPSGVIGNYLGLPTGTNRLWVSLASRLPVVSARLDGVEIDWIPSSEAGLDVSDVFIDIPPGRTATLSLDLEGELNFDDDPTHRPILLRLPPLVRPMVATVTFDFGIQNPYSETFDGPGTFR